MALRGVFGWSAKSFNCSIALSGNGSRAPIRTVPTHFIVTRRGKDSIIPGMAILKSPYILAVHRHSSKASQEDVFVGCDEIAVEIAELNQSLRL